MNPEPPHIPDPYSTYSFKPENNRFTKTRPSLSALLWLLWAVMSLACLGLDAFLLLMLLVFELPYVFKGHTSVVVLPLLLLTAVVLWLTWFSLRQWLKCIRGD